MGYSFNTFGRSGGRARGRRRGDRHAVGGLERLEGRTLFAATPFDPTFGVLGRSYVDVAGMAEDASVVHLLPDGKILIAGDATFGVDLNVEGVQRAFVARLNPDGSLDNTFGAGGIATYPDDVSVGLNNATIPLNPYVHRTWSIAVGPDGRVFVGGQTTTYYPKPDGNPQFPWQYDDAFGVLAVGPDGVVDTTFGTKGVAIADMKHMLDGGDTEWVFALAVQTDGKVVAAGMVGKEGDDQNDMGVVRFNTDGSVDPTFGKQVENFPRLNADRPRMEYATAVTIQGDGKIVIAGRTAAKDGVTSAVALVRYNPDGGKDSTFGQGGCVMTPLAPPDPDMPPEAWGVDKVHQVLVQPDGKLVVAAKVGVKLVGLLRYNPDGSPDASFGTNGVVIAQAVTVGDVHVEYQPSDGGLSLAVTGNGMEKIPVETEPNTFTTRQLGAQAYVARFDAAGRRVSSARSDGAAMTGDEYLAALAVRPDGKLVVAGGAHVLPNNGEGSAWAQTGDAFVVRIDPAGLAADPTDPVTGNLSGTFAALRGLPVARGKAMKFQLAFNSADAARHTAVRVTGPNAFDASAQLMKVKSNRAGTSAVASYRLDAPGGKFDAGDNGNYAIRLGGPDGAVVGAVNVALRQPRGSAFRRLTVAGVMNDSAAAAKRDAAGASVGESVLSGSSAA
jgi:uncharacterized delta-60 repeat protein